MKTFTVMFGGSVTVNVPDTVSTSQEVIDLLKEQCGNKSDLVERYQEHLEVTVLSEETVRDVADWDIRVSKR